MRKNFHVKLRGKLNEKKRKVLTANFFTSIE